MGFIRRGSRVFLIREASESQNLASAEIKSAILERNLIRERRAENQLQLNAKRPVVEHQLDPHQDEHRYQVEQERYQRDQSGSDGHTLDLDFYESISSPDIYRPKAPAPPFTPPSPRSPANNAQLNSSPLTKPSRTMKYLSSDHYDRCVVSLLHGHRRHLLVTEMCSEEIGDRLTVLHLQKSVQRVTGIPPHRQNLVLGTTRLDLTPDAMLSDMSLNEKTLVRVQSTRAQECIDNVENLSKTIVSNTNCYKSII